VFLPEVYVASFGRDVKPLVPGCWLVLAISSYLVSHPTSGGFLSKQCGFSRSQDTQKEQQPGDVAYQRLSVTCEKIVQPCTRSHVL